MSKWTAQDMADHFDALDKWTSGMSHSERVDWLANEVYQLNDDEQLTESKDLAGKIIAAWEASKHPEGRAEEWIGPR